MFNLIVGLLLAVVGYYAFKPPKRRDLAHLDYEDVQWAVKYHISCEILAQLKKEYGIEEAKRIAVQQERERFRSYYLEKHGCYPEEDPNSVDVHTKEYMRRYWIREWRMGRITKEELDKKLIWVRDEYDPYALDKYIEKLDRQIYGDEGYEFRKKMGLK